MKLRTLFVIFLGTSSAGWLAAADPQLLNLVMPDAKLVGGINVDQAKASPFGQYVVNYIRANDPHLQQIITETGFDPTTDLHELLLAANGNGKTAAHLTLARGLFSPAKINSAAQNAGATSLTYNGITIMENKQGTQGYAFLSSSIAVAGDLAAVKAAIDRQTAPATLPASLMVSINQLSTTEDAWGISELPPPVAAAPLPAGTNLPKIPPSTFQSVQQATGGVKFGTEIVANAQLQTDTAQNATALAQVLQFLVNLGEVNSQQNAQLAAVLKDVTIGSSGTTVNVSATVPESAAEALVNMHSHARAHANAQPRQRRQ